MVCRKRCDSVMVIGMGVCCSSRKISRVIRISGKSVESKKGSNRK